MNKDQLAARLLATFLGELEEQVRVLNAGLLALEGQPADPEQLKALFRVAHSLKGAARAANTRPVEEACHALETLLADVRDGKRVLGHDEFELLFFAVDALADAGRRLRAGSGLVGSPLSELLARLQGGGSPDREEGAPSAAAPSLAVPAERGDGHVRVQTEKLDELLTASAHLGVTAGRLAEGSADLETQHEEIARWAAEWRRAGRRVRLALERAAAPPSVTQSLGTLEEDLRRLVRETKRIAQRASADSRLFVQATAGLADRVRRLRMRPFADACEALPRLVRDLATGAGKEVRLEIEGGEVEADRAVLEGIRTALLHLVRNAVDHGIEPPAEREDMGKSRRGAIKVGAALRGDRVVVTVADDGRGLDVAAIGERLRQRGLPVPTGHHDLARGLFGAGISTRAETTPISGRGVGLDAVRAAVERLGGRVEVGWVEGAGTTFTLECPLTLATLRAVLVAVGPQIVCVPTTHVERLLRLSPEGLRRSEGRDVIPHPDGPVPVVALARLLPPLVERPFTGAIPMVLLAAGGRRLAVAVDELVAERELVLRPVERGEKRLPHVAGAAILASGGVALVIDTPAVVAAGLAPSGARGLALAEKAPEGRHRPRILVVDDSITTRTLEQSILEAAGYEVTTAVDGADAWRLLQEEAADLVVADVDMPRLDGFALCEAIRASKRFRTLPVVLVTALESPEHRARGLEVGADAYIGKSSFDQQNLLDTIRQLVG
ncbi:MAG: response regulator [Gemmatimonadetes bacterium]|nr:response regulator [Gemmatimonadota bacterium]